VAAAIAARNDASVLVFSVTTPETEGDATAFLAEGREALNDAPGPVPVVETGVTEAAAVTDAIVEEASAHDVVVLGATRQGALRRALAGSVPRRVVERTDRTVVLARAGDAVGGPLHGLGRLLRR
jgi:nucleotide-binding universal stress UspA family protein